MINTIQSKTFFLKFRLILLDPITLLTVSIALIAQVIRTHFMVHFAVWLSILILLTEYGVYSQKI